DHRVAVGAALEHPEVRLAVADVPVELDERAGIEELDEPLAREQLSLLALALDGLVGAAVLGLVPQLLELVELPLRRVGTIVRGGHVRRSLAASVERTCEDCAAWTSSGFSGRSRSSSAANRSTLEPRNSARSSRSFCFTGTRSCRPTGSWTTSGATSLRRGRRRHSRSMSRSFARHSGRSGSSRGRPDTSCGSAKVSST